MKGGPSSGPPLLLPSPSFETSMQSLVLEDEVHSVSKQRADQSESRWRRAAPRVKPLSLRSGLERAAQSAQVVEACELADIDSLTSLISDGAVL